MGVTRSLKDFVLDDDNTIRPLQLLGCSRRAGVSKISSSSSSHNSRREPLDSPLVLVLLLLIIMVSFLF